MGSMSPRLLGWRFSVVVIAVDVVVVIARALVQVVAKSYAHSDGASFAATDSDASRCTILLLLLPYRPPALQTLILGLTLISKYKFKSCIAFTPCASKFTCASTC